MAFAVLSEVKMLSQLAFGFAWQKSNPGSTSMCNGYVFEFSQYSSYCEQGSAPPTLGSRVFTHRIFQQSNLYVVTGKSQDALIWQQCTAAVVARDNRLTITVTMCSYLLTLHLVRLLVAPLCCQFAVARIHTSNILTM